MSKAKKNTARFSFNYTGKRISFSLSFRPSFAAVFASLTAFAGLATAVLTFCGALIK